eukprot:CAMPEP_0178760366 /NCGR_PEP_ID=MMETSP0744-20121128/15447_1 /TAXON_ID=913974 /ORGANISM="Nitzschia punctata, Strain CCMP561" /LENGTH=423 /DNA_ID=CAMNT_0020414925 /DNA_START=15 /DNA_END=1286 /DNA_ORIENTATION=-
MKATTAPLAVLGTMLSTAVVVVLSTTPCPTYANPVADARNFKKGLAMHKAESCNALAGHKSSSWWYSWSAQDGFYDSFCETPDQAAESARTAGMEFVPMFWSTVPSFDKNTSRMTDDRIHANLQQSRYLMTFNEPDLPGQADMTPLEAAQLWPQIETIALTYNIEVVGPCVTQDHGTSWYANWTVECNNLYGRDCAFDYTCLHLYYQPYTTNTTAYKCDPTDHEWACIQSGSNQTHSPSRAHSKLMEWVDNYPGKLIWVTEYACAPWGSTKGCSAQEQQELMEQLTPLLESHPAVFRYAWFSLYGGDDPNPTWVGNGLNEDIWTQYHGIGCVGRKWLAPFGPDVNWNIQTMNQCLAIADADPECSSPLVLSIDDDSCYCSSTTFCTLETTWSAMTTWINAANRSSSSLSNMGDLYETFGSITI